LHALPEKLVKTLKPIKIPFNGGFAVPLLAVPTREQDGKLSCFFYSEGLCRMYRYRPLQCRLTFCPNLLGSMADYLVMCFYKLAITHFLETLALKVTLNRCDVNSPPSLLRFSSKLYGRFKELVSGYLASHGRIVTRNAMLLALLHCSYLLKPRVKPFFHLSGGGEPAYAVFYGDGVIESARKLVKSLDGLDLGVKVRFLPKGILVF